MNTLPTTMPVTVPLYRLAHGRTGDKGNRSNISVIAWHPALWELLVEQVTEQAVVSLVTGHGFPYFVRPPVPLSPHLALI